MVAMEVAKTSQHLYFFFSRSETTKCDEELHVAYQEKFGPKVFFVWANGKMDKAREVLREDYRSNQF